MTTLLPLVTCVGGQAKNSQGLLKPSGLQSFWNLPLAPLCAHGQPPPIQRQLSLAAQHQFRASTTSPAVQRQPCCYILNTQHTDVAPG